MPGTMRACSRCMQPGRSLVRPQPWNVQDMYRCSTPEQTEADMEVKPAQLIPVDNELKAPVIGLTNTTSVSSVQEVRAAEDANSGKYGFLESLPLNCIQLILKHQPDDFRSFARLMLFESCKCLARRILEITPNVTIGLDRGSELTSEQAQARRQIITDLLSARQEFRVKLWPKGFPRFSPELADRVTSMSLHDTGTQAASGCPWAAMTNLRTIHFLYWKQDGSYMLDMAHSSTLCEAMETGQLQQLCALHLPLYNAIQGLDRLIQAVGPQLAELTCSCGDLVMKVSQLAVLQRINLDSCNLTESMMQQLAEHPTLRHVTFKRCAVQGDHSKRSCSWETLSVHNAELCTLLQLPLAARQIRLLHGLACRNISSVPNAKSMLAQHGHKMVCVPSDSYGVFELAKPCELLASIIMRMRDVQELRVMSALGVHVVSWLWQALPASVSIFKTLGYLCGDSRLLWREVPQHVTSVELQLCPARSKCILSMIHNTPGHVQRLVLGVPHPEHASDWSIADLHAAAPNHLELQLHDKQYAL